MKAFHTIAVPHSDILEGRLTMDVFAADIWQVANNRGPDEYKDAKEFFKKTYLTQGLKHLLDVVEKRLSGKGGDPVIQVQTPFGGGKTHSLIAMYHNSGKWKAKNCVIVGTALKPTDTLWGIIEKQLTGKIKDFKELTAPGKEKLYELLLKHQPLMILGDELLEYVTKAAGVSVGVSNLASQTIAFMQELTEAAGALEKVAVVLTLPSSNPEHFDDKAEELFQKLQKTTGRVEKIYTPVQDDEVPDVIRQRLFSSIKMEAAKKIVGETVEYMRTESILPVGIEPSEYRDRFEKSYPFIPEVVDVLYHQWGSFPNFQRTRGVLRLLSLVIYDLRNKTIPFIGLADFNLANQEIRRELIKHIGNQYDTVIAADITSKNSGAKKVDKGLGDAYKGLNLGTRAANTVFLYSFSGGGEKGINPQDIKRISTTLDNPSNEILEVLEKLKENLYYLHQQGGKYYFTTVPNIRKLRNIRMGNIEERQIRDIEREILKKNILGTKMKTFIWPESDKDIPDNSDIKLVIVDENDEKFLKKIFENKGDSPRVCRNTVFFLASPEMERAHFKDILRKLVAYQEIHSDETIALTEEQKREIRSEIKNIESSLNENLRQCYRLLYVPGKNGLKIVDMGIPTYGETRKVDDNVYEKLRSDGEILERTVPLVIKEKYLKPKKYVLTAQIYDSSLKTPGETRFLNESVLTEGIESGVRQGLFGLGELEADNAICRFYREDASAALSGNEALISEEICKNQQSSLTPPHPPLPEPRPNEDGKVKPETGERTSKPVEFRNRIGLNFTVPKGKIADIARILNFLHQKFDLINIDLKAEEGEISEQDYENKVKEAFLQLKIDFKEKG